MGIVGDDDVGAREQVVADGNAADSGQMGVSTDVASISDLDFWLVLALREDRQNGVFVYLTVVAYSHQIQTVGAFQWTPKDGVAAPLFEVPTPVAGVNVYAKGVDQSEENWREDVAQQLSCSFSDGFNESFHVRFFRID